MEQRFWCLDALSISWTGWTEHRVSGTLLEVWSSGGVIQTEEPIAKGETFTISVHGAQFEARVEKYERDEYGYYVEFRLAGSWFPVNYEPPYLMN